MYAARLATALKQRLDVALFGMGGSQMRAAGVEIITDYSEVSVVGITEVLKRLPSLRRAMKHLVDEAERRRPPLAILTDFPGFHLRLARKLLPKAFATSTTSARNFGLGGPGAPIWSGGGSHWRYASSHSKRSSTPMPVYR